MASSQPAIDPGSGQIVILERRDHSTIHIEGERGKTLCGSENHPTTRDRRLEFQEGLRECPICQLIEAGEASPPVTECKECGFDANANRGAEVEEAARMLADHMEQDHYGNES